MAKTETIRARIEPELKRQAEALFAQLGLSTTEAIRLFYKQATLQRGLPFAVRLPNADTREALRQAQEHEDLIEYEGLEDLKVGAPLSHAPAHHEAVRAGPQTKSRRRSKNLDKLWAVADLLLREQPLAPHNRAHRLAGDWSGAWECHIEADWLLIWQRDEDCADPGENGHALRPVRLNATSCAHAKGRDRAFRARLRRRVTVPDSGAVWRERGVL